MQSIEAVSWQSLVFVRPLIPLEEDYHEHAKLYSVYWSEIQVSVQTRAAKRTSAIVLRVMI